MPPPAQPAGSASRGARLSFARAGSDPRGARAQIRAARGLGSAQREGPSFSTPHTGHG
jgi:hypothetical protein